MRENKQIVGEILIILEDLQRISPSTSSNDVVNKFIAVTKDWMAQIESLEEEEDLEKFFRNWQTGEHNIKFFIQAMKDFAPEEKKRIAPLFIKIKNIMEKFYTLTQAIIQKEKVAKDKAESFPLELDYLSPHIVGKMHPLRITMIALYNILNKMGFTIKIANNIEQEEYNFDYLNIPKNHPARDMQDTFFINSNQQDKVYLLRTHTSNAQIKTLLAEKPPIKIFSMGPVFRNEAVDRTHSSCFHQLELMYIGENANIINLRAIITNLLGEFFQEHTEIRFRSSFFPFVEPGFEVDLLFKGKWLEIGGCGIIHPNVLKNCGISQDIIGFAVGIGIDRLHMIANNIDDIRSFYCYFPHLFTSLQNKNSFLSLLNSTF
jgi:phenylalanyl-tRNA synthetase alpha chain